MGVKITAILFIIVVGLGAQTGLWYLSTLLFDWTVWQFLAAQALTLYVAFLFGVMGYLFFEGASQNMRKREGAATPLVLSKEHQEYVRKKQEYMDFVQGKSGGWG